MPQPRRGPRGERQFWALERQFCPFQRQKTLEICLSIGHHLSVEATKWIAKLSQELPNLRKLQFSPTENPFMAPVTVEIIDSTSKRRYVQTGKQQDLIDPATGEVHSVSMIRKVEIKDDAEFVKVFAEGVKAAFELKAPGTKVFQAVLDAYQREKMTGGFADCLSLFWFDGGLDGRAIGISEKTFQRGLKELLAKDFLRPKQPNVYWVNPALFFKGNRVAFVNEYRRAPAPKAIEADPRQMDIEDYT